VKLAKKIFVFILLICFSLIYKAQAEDSPTQLAQAAFPQEKIELAVGMGGRISLDLRNIEVVDALKFLSMKIGLNIISTKDVAGKITLMVQDVPAQDVFDIMLRSNGLAYTKEGEIYNIMTGDEYKALFGKKFADIREVKVFRIKYAIPEQVFTLLDALKSDIGRVLVEPDSGTALIMDTPGKIKEIETALSTLEQKNLVRVFQLKYAKAKDVEEQLKAQLDLKKVGTIKADERSNQVIVQTLSERMENIEKMILSLDKKTKEVLIDTQIIKVKLTDQVDSGAEWEGLFGAASKYGMSYFGSTPFSVMAPTTISADATNPFQSRSDFLKSIGNQIGAYPFSGNTANSASGSKTGPGIMHVGILDSKNDFDVLLKYLKTLGNTQILSNPKIAVINNQEAKIHVGERQAYVTSTVTEGQSGLKTTAEDVTFVDVGISLSVTPTINDDGYVTMKVKPEISSVVSTLTTGSGNKIPIIDSSMAETTVMVKDGSTIIIGGLRKDEKTSSAEQLPFLGKVPVLNFFFKQQTKKTERTELLVMITPHIVAGDTLVTGDEHEPAFGNKPSKEYKEYPSLAEKVTFSPPKQDLEKKIEPKALPEEEIKPYQEYPRFKEEKAYVPTLKGDQSDE
jgi:type II secretory pathway component GspD/PulD (secretin)